VQPGLDNNQICNTVVMVVTYRTKQIIITWPLITCVKILISHLRLAFCNITQYCAGDKIEKNEMGWACGAYG